MQRKRVLPGGSLALLLAAGALAASGEQARELGEVRWSRDFPAALAEARASGRPVLVLFQEVPGCATCVGFGETALSHPLLVEAAETDFVPVAVLNNRPGADREVLERYREPAWNDPVVRFLDADGRDLIPRRDGIYTAPGLAQRMRAALEAAGRESPAYLEWVDAGAAADFERVTFATHCFWEGEACLGSEPSVVATRASWHEGREVVEVWFDPAKASFADLLARARRRGCAERVVVREASQRRLAAAVFGDAVTVSPDPARPAPDADQKRHLRGTRYADLPLTRFQQARVNAALASGGEPTRWLSPRQRRAVAR